MIDKEIVKKDYVDPITAAGLLKVSRSRINLLCREGRFEGAIKTGWSWLIPKTAIDNFQRLKRGPKPKAQRQQNNNKAIINNALIETMKWKDGEQNDE